MKQGKINKNARASNTKKGQGDWHVSKTPIGMGDHYGTGVRAKLGRVRDSMGVAKLGQKKMKTPPTSVV